MRILPSDEHQARREKILQAVVHLFIKTGKPVGSATILDNYHVAPSPATIRNVLAELEKDGFLTHPHASAGRVPTDRGYRFYVNSIVNIQRLAVVEEQKIREEYLQRRREIDELMQSTTRVLSTLSQCTAFMLPPNQDIDRLRHIELVVTGPTQILGVLVSETGFVRNHLIHVDRAPDELTLREACRFLNERLTGMLFSEAHSRLAAELGNFSRQRMLEQQLIQSLAQHLFGVADVPNLVVKGTSHIFRFPEFHDFDAMRNFAHLVDERRLLGEALSHGFENEGIQVRIGSEVRPDLKDFSVVASGYHVRGRPVGVLGILGPKRMEYERMIAIVNTVAKAVNRFLENNSNLLEDRSK